MSKLFHVFRDLRAKLEVAVEKILDLSKQQEEPPLDSDYTSDSEDVSSSNSKIQTLKKLFPILA